MYIIGRRNLNLFIRNLMNKIRAIVKTIIINIESPSYEVINIYYTRKLKILQIYLERSINYLIF